jgi:hypothetical protein
VRQLAARHCEVLPAEPVPDVTPKPMNSHEEIEHLRGLVKNYPANSFAGDRVLGLLAAYDARGRARRQPMSEPIAKEGKLFCPELLTWIRRQRCIACREQREATGSLVLPPIGSDPHHVEGKGMGGARCRDDRVIPLCRRHHEEAQAYRIPRSTQERWACETLFEFLEDSTVEEARAYFDALEVWKDRPLVCPF